MQGLISAQYEAINIMAMGAYPKFLLSDYYAEYLRSISPVPTSSEVSISEQNGIVDATVQNKMSAELERILTGSSWLSGLLSSIESLPVCVSLAAASRNTRGFPLIYVNAAFETTTGYDRCEILGQVRTEQNRAEQSRAGQSYSRGGRILMYPDYILC